MQYPMIFFVYFILCLNASVAMNNSSEEEENLSLYPKNSLTSKKQKIIQNNEAPKNSKKIFKRKNNHEINKVQNNSEVRPTKKHKQAEKTKRGDKKEEQDIGEIATFQKNLEDIKQQIQEGHREPNWKRIYLGHKMFETLDYDESLWEIYARDSKAYQWPSQKNWKDVVGGHLFFPEKTLEWENIYPESYNLRRIDNLWAFAVGAKFNHALSKLYLAKMLDKLRSEYTDAATPEFFKRFYKEAFIDLKKSPDNPDACYVIGTNYRYNSYSVAEYLGEEVDRVTLGCKNAIEWHETGKDLKNQFGILEVKSNAKSIYIHPTADEYLALARAGYMQAYTKAAELIKDDKERKKIRKEAIEKGYNIAWLGLGGMYKIRGRIDKARECFAKAGEIGITSGYIKLGISYLGDIQSEMEMKEKPLNTRTKEEIENGIKAFRLAGKAGNPEGWEYLARLYQQLYEKKLISKEDYQDKMHDTLCEGTWLGSASCYHTAYFRLTDSTFSFILKNYGMPPQHELRYTIEQFINKKD